MGLGRLTFINGSFCFALGLLQVLPLLIALTLGELEAFNAFGASMVILLLVGGGFSLGFRARNRSDSNLFLALAPVSVFVTASLAVAMPFYFLDPDLSFIGAYYEGMSLFTTSGASQYEDMQRNATSLMAWRAIAAWIGGVTSIICILVVFTRLNLGAARLHPKSMIGFADQDMINQAAAAAKIFVPLYGFVTCVAAILYAFSGVPLAKAMYFAMGTISLTGLPLTQDMMPYLFTWQVQVLMMMGFLLMSINWDSFYAAISRRHYKFHHDPELRAYMVFLIIALAIVVITHVFSHGMTGLGHSLFLGLSALSSNGWDNMPNTYIGLPVSLVLVMLMSVGGSLITAGGGIKQLRFRLLMALGRRELDRLGHPNGAYPMKMGEKSIRDQDMGAMWLLVALTTLTLLAATLLLSVQGIEFTSAFLLSVVHLTLSAPILSAIDPDFFGFSGLFDGELVILTFVLLIGRLETMALLLILGRRFLK